MKPRSQSITRRVALMAGVCLASLSLASAQTYTITAKSSSGGTISPVGKVSVAAGGSQTFMMTPDPGHEITQVVADKVNLGVVSSYTFLNVQKSTSIKATFKIQSFALSFSALNGVTIKPSGSQTYKYGKGAKITVTPPTGSTATPVLTVDGVPVTLVPKGKKFSYTLPVTGPHVVVASLTPQHSATVTKAGTGGGTVTSVPAGIDCGATCAANYDDGTMITLTAVADANSTFTGWSGNCAGTGTCSLTLSADKAVTATFQAIQHTLTVSKNGTGTGSVVSTPAGIACGATCAALFNQASSVTLTATATAGSTFTGWSGGGCSGTGTCLVTLGADTTVTATFTLGAVQHTLTVSKAGTGTGTVTSAPAGINCGATCDSMFNNGASIVLTAVATAGSTFGGWSGGGCSGTSTCNVTLNADTTVTATFTLTVVQHTLTVSKNGTGSGTVTSSPAGINCGGTCASQFNNGTSITLTAAAAGGSTFTGWSGGGCSGTGTCPVTLNSDTTVTATFTTSGGGGLSLHVIDDCDLAGVGAIVAVHNANGSVNQTFTVGASGLVDLSAFSSPLTFTVGWANSQAMPNAEIQSFVDVPASLGTFTVTLTSQTCAPTDPLLGSVTVNLNPQPLAFASVEPLGTWLSTSKVFNVHQSDLQSDGKLSLLATNDPLGTGPQSYGFLLDQTFTNGATYTINVNKTTTGIPFSAADDISGISVFSDRKGAFYSLSTYQQFDPLVMSGTIELRNQFTATTYGVGAMAPFAFDTFGFPTSSANWIHIQPAAPASVTIPALFHMATFTYSSVAVMSSWTLAQGGAGNVGLVGFSNVRNSDGDDRHWTIVLDPVANSSWSESDLVLPAELSIAGRVPQGPSMFAYRFSYISTYTNGLKNLYAGGVTPPATYDYVVAYITP